MFASGGSRPPKRRTAMATKKRTIRRPSTRRRRSGSPKWEDWPTERVLDLRLCDLDVHIEGSPVEVRIQRVLRELRQRGMRFRPYFWVSDEWFTPDGVPGCAVPFYLLHPKLTRIEQSRMLEAEGSDRATGLKILRHEVGHAIDHAYRLHLRRKRQKLFGRSSKPYPEVYLPQPHSRRFVQHLHSWYAQAHPDEDFAETFAVWLQPRSGWSKLYDGWPALKKLEYVDGLMDEIADQAPVVRSRSQVESLHRITKTLRQYYAEKQERYGSASPDFLDRDLRRLFSDAPEYARNETAAAFLRRVRPEIRRMVSRWTGRYQYTLDQVLKDVITRSRELRLRLVEPPEQTKVDTAIMLTVQAMDFLYSGRRWISL